MYNIFKPHIVEKNGMYAIRKFFFLWLYKDLTTIGVFWWSKGSEYVKDCYTTDLPKLQKIMQNENYKWRRVK